MSKVEEYKELRRKAQEAVDAARVILKDAIKEVWEQFFEKHPEITKVSWTAYAPYFNDGDPCEFHVNDVEINGVDRYGYSDESDEETEVSEEIYNEAEAFQNIFDEDDLEYVFGNHVRVVITKEEIKVEDYTDHD